MGRHGSLNLSRFNCSRNSKTANKKCYSFWVLFSWLQRKDYEINRRWYWDHEVKINGQAVGQSKNSFSFALGPLLQNKGLGWDIAIFFEHEYSTKPNSRKQPHFYDSCLHNLTLREIRACPQMYLCFGKMICQRNPTDHLCWIISQNLPSYDFSTIFLKVDDEALNFLS